MNSEYVLDHSFPVSRTFEAKLPQPTSARVGGSKEVGGGALDLGPDRLARRRLPTGGSTAG